MCPFGYMSKVHYQINHMQKANRTLWEGQEEDLNKACPSATRPQGRSLSQSRMGAVPGLVLLLMLAVLGIRAAPSPEECHKLTKPVTKADVQSVSGDWVLVWYISDNISTSNEWTKLKTSYVEQRVHSGVIRFTERNMLKNNSCMTFKTNMTAGPEGQNTFIYTSGTMEVNGVDIEYPGNGTVKFFETCADCMSMEYSGFFGHFLLIYRRYGVHQNVEVLKAAQDEGQKLAECLGFSIDEPFIYDGVSDFCHKKSSPEVKPEQD
uniref:Tribytltin binding protein type 2a n=1 Tax=Takifugu rubripes TaxID=31033 RepID=A0A674MTV5_TAKRU